MLEVTWLLLEPRLLACHAAPPQDMRAWVVFLKVCINGPPRSPTESSTHGMRCFFPHPCASALLEGIPSSASAMIEQLKYVLGAYSSLRLASAILFPAHCALLRLLAVVQE